ncbi:hypothetical protein CCAL12920_09080 [Campylobacter sp. RM12920]|uniref:Uncharacterized protein n=1 Tax=Campylobacter californiensis TaxID=1032243 RepID=A0ABD4JIT5_9BACT|nr:hypothetical protein [Campylobacter sp. RM12919]MBE2989021.1 hypothetical protein [Campylobacter sp. RM12920]
MKKCNKQEICSNIRPVCRSKTTYGDIERELGGKLVRIRFKVKKTSLSDLTDEFYSIGSNYFKFDERDYDRIDKAVENELLNLKEDLKALKIPKKFIDAILKDKAKKLKKREFARRALYQEILSKR